MKQWWWIIVAGIVIGGGVWAYMYSSSDTDGDGIPETASQGMDQNMDMTPATSTPSGPSSVTSPTDQNAVTINVSGQNFSFTPSTITVKKGQTVTINFTSAGGFHDWVIDEFDAHTKQIQTGQTSSVTFVADKAGSFEYYCSVGSHRQLGMKGTLIVQ